MSSLPLAKQGAVVSGATSDLGKAICARLAAAGARLALLGRDPERLAAVADGQSTANGAPLVLPMDLESEDSIGSAAAAIGTAWGHVDVLIHGAGQFAMGPLEQAPTAELDLQYLTNVRGPCLLTRALLPMLRASRGQVVFLNSTVGLAARAEVGHYAATQHALRALADALRAEVNGHGVRVLSVYLGRTATARQARIFALEGRDYRPELLLQPDAVAQMVLAALCLPATAEVTELRMRPQIKSY